MTNVAQSLDEFESQIAGMKPQSSKRRFRNDYSSFFVDIDDNSDSYDDSSDLPPDKQSLVDFPDVPGAIIGAKIPPNENAPILFFTKLVGKSHIHAKFMTEDELRLTVKGRNCLSQWNSRVKKYDIILSEFQKDLYVPNGYEIIQDWFEIERIIDERMDPKCGRIYLVKWQSLEYSDSTWELEEYVDEEAPELLEEYYKRLNHSVPKHIPSNWHRPRPENFQQIKDPIVSKTGEYQLKDYQMEGVNWLLNCYVNQKNSILGDEMGLGKTAQLICTLRYLSETYGINGPFLIIAPLSTLCHWASEFKEWTNFNPVIFHGKESYKLIKETEFKVVDENGRVVPNRLQFDVLIMSYDTAHDQTKLLQGIDWHYMVVDEGHRLKNHNSILFSDLMTVKAQHITLLTGTPIQNNFEELFSLLHFLDRKNFPDVEELSEKYTVQGTTVEKVDEIREMIKPILLRRAKADVELDIKPKEEIIIDVELTRPQKMYYKAVFNDNREVLLRKLTKQSNHQLISICMELRKICNHPFLINGAEKQITEEKAKEMKLPADNPEVKLRALIDASGKFILLDKLLPKLQREGHKVLIFSQFVIVLNLIEDFVISRGYKYERLDGSTTAKLRQPSINRFNNDPDSFLFLITTRAGGAGINLTSADTVIIYDTDWNPMNDLQAMSRCHRIGQKNTVKVYRLISRETYEQKMAQVAAKKLGINHILLEGKSVESTLTTQEIEDIIRHGISHVFDDDNTDCDRFTEADIDQILDLNAKVQEKDLISGGHSIFARTAFGVENDNTPRINSETFWKEVLPDVNMDEESSLPIVRRCRQEKYEKALKEEMQNAYKAQINKTIASIIDKGYIGIPEELNVLRDATMTYPFKSKDDEYNAILRYIGTIPSSQSTDESVIELVTKNSDKIVDSVIFFHRLRAALKVAQDPNIIWPSVVPSWGTPQKEYAVLLALSKSGWDQYSNEVNKAEYCMGHTHIQTPAKMEKHIKKLVDKLLEGVSIDMDVMDAKYELPDEWLKNHPLLNKADSTNQSMIVDAVYKFGLPTLENGEPDWEYLIEADAMNMEYKEVKELGDKLIKNLKENASNFKYRDGEELLKVIELFEPIHSTAKLMQKNKHISFHNLPNLPKWWTILHTKFFITSIHKYGRTRVSTWIMDDNSPFINEIQENMKKRFENAMAKEYETNEARFPPGDKTMPKFLRKDEDRIAAAHDFAKAAYNPSEPVNTAQIIQSITQNQNQTQTQARVGAQSGAMHKPILPTYVKPTVYHITPQLPGYVIKPGLPLYTIGSDQNTNQNRKQTGAMMPAHFQVQSLLANHNLKDVTANNASPNRTSNQKSHLSNIAHPKSLAMQSPPKEQAKIYPQKVTKRIIWPQEEVFRMETVTPSQSVPPAQNTSTIGTSLLSEPVRPAPAPSIPLTKPIVGAEPTVVQTQSSVRTKTRLFMTLADVERLNREPKVTTIPPTPIQISENIIVFSYGRIIPEPSYRGKLTPFPVGFVSKITNPFGDEVDVEYESRIEAGNGKPVFIVTREGQKVGEGNSPSNAWKQAIRTVHKKIPKLSGSANFGLTNSYIEKILARMEELSHV